MGSASSKLKRYLQNGDEFAAMQVYQNSPDLCENLDPSISYGDNHNQNTPLHYAASHGMKHLLRAFMFEHGANPNKLNGSLESAIHCACKVGVIKSPSMEERRTMCVSILLTCINDQDENKPQLDIQNKDRNTPLHIAANSGLIKCIESLISHGADPFITNKNKETACDIAFQAGYYEIAAFLERVMVFYEAPEACPIEPQSSSFNEPESTLRQDASEDTDLYAGMRAQDLQEAKDRLLVETADMLHIPLFTAEALLRDNEWSKTLLLERWMRNAVECCKTAGVPPPQSVVYGVPIRDSISSDRGEAAGNAEKFNLMQESKRQKSNNKEVTDNTCGICFGELPSKGISTPTCGHSFCSFCWESYLRVKIEENQGQNILCPAVNCNILVDLEFIEQMVSPQLARKYLKFDIEAFVERNKTIKWCPLPGCGRAVRIPDAEFTTIHSTYYYRISHVEQKISHAVDCGNGHYFCWECLGEPHAPCGCEQWTKWQDKIAELRPGDLKINNADTEETANLLWLLTNSKPCPNCKSPIQRTEGCNHMKCSKCKHVFCWVCLESWKKHSTATGGYFRCNRFSVQLKTDSHLNLLISEASAKSQKMQELTRFVNFYTKFKQHQESLDKEQPLLDLAQIKMELLAKAFENFGKENREKETIFIKESLKEVVKCRRFICGSYVYAFYQKDNSYDKVLFEALQRALEDSTEKMAETVARQYLITRRSDIIKLTLACKRCRKGFIRALSTGVRTCNADCYGMSRSISIGAHPVLNLIPNQGLHPINFGKDGHSSDFSSFYNPWPGKPKSPSFADWPRIRSEQRDVASGFTSSSFVGKCRRKSCSKMRPKGPNGWCSLRCAQIDYNFPSADASNQAEPLTNMWEDYDYSSDLLIALEMSRLQHIEEMQPVVDEARRRKLWLQERYRDHRFCGHQKMAPNASNGLLLCQTLPRTNFSARASQNISKISVENPIQQFSRSRMSNGPDSKTADGLFGANQPIGSGSRFYCMESNLNHPVASCSKELTPPVFGRERFCDIPTLPSYISSEQKVSSTQITFDYFLKAKRHLNEEYERRMSKNLNPVKQSEENEDGRFQYGDLHEKGHILSFLLTDSRRALKRSQSVGDLTDRSSSDFDWVIDSDHSHHQDNPEEKNKLRITQLLANLKDSLETESPSVEENGNDIIMNRIRKGKKNENYQGGKMEISAIQQGKRQNLSDICDSIPKIRDSKTTGVLKVKGVKDAQKSSLRTKSSLIKVQDEFKNTVRVQDDIKSSRMLQDECLDNLSNLKIAENNNLNKTTQAKHTENEKVDEASRTKAAGESALINSNPENSTQQGETLKETPNLKIEISSPKELETQSSNECESETGIPKSPTLYISGVSINRSPEPASPQTILVAKPRTSTLALPLLIPQEKLGTPPASSKRRIRSSSMTVPKSKKSELSKNGENTSKTDITDRSFHLSALSLPSPNFSINELRLSKSASEPDKGRLIFNFAKSPTEGTLSSILHVKEKTLSSEDFHEALFLSKSPHKNSSKKKKNKALN